MKTEEAKCCYCGRTFTRSVRKHPRLYCKTSCERLHLLKPVTFRSLPHGDRYEDRQHIQLDYEGQLDPE